MADLGSIAKQYSDLNQQWNRGQPKDKAKVDFLQYADIWVITYDLDVSSSESDEGLPDCPLLPPYRGDWR